MTGCFCRGQRDRPGVPLDRDLCCVNKEIEGDTDARVWHTNRPFPSTRSAREPTTLWLARGLTHYRCSSPLACRPMPLPAKFDAPEPGSPMPTILTSAGPKNRWPASA